MVVYLLCQRCGGTAFGETEQEARDKINHSQGLSRGIACGDNYNQVIIIGEKTYRELTGQTLPDIDQKPKTIVKTDEGKYAKAENKSSKTIVFGATTKPKKNQTGQTKQSTKTKKEPKSSSRVKE